MKLSIAIADTHALPSAFVVFRGFENSIKYASELGYHGIELALKRPVEIKAAKLDMLLKDNNIEVSCISTGQVYADLGLSFTDTPSDKKNTLIKIFHDFIDLAVNYGGMVNIGRVRGNIGKTDSDLARRRFIETVHPLTEYAKKKGVTLLLEPVNRYEIDFINSVKEGVDLIKELKTDAIRLMPDVFHMNIEDVTIGGEIEKWIDYIGYIHLADSNRLAPGSGHTDFDDVFKHIKKSGYNGWFSVEILPKPEPYQAAKSAIQYLRNFINT